MQRLVDYEVTSGESCCRGGRVRAPAMFSEEVQIDGLLPTGGTECSLRLRGMSSR